jgi:glycosyltransferase involved in cell wall biosynthesis
MRVMHIASGDLWAGAEVMLYNLARAQAASGAMEVSAVVLNEGRLAQSLAAAGVATVILPETEMGFAGLAAAVRSQIRRRAPDIIHTHRFKEDLLGALGAVGRRIVCVRTVHGRDEAATAAFKFRIGRAAHARAIDMKFAMTIAVSRSLQAELAQRFGSERVGFIPNGIDLEGSAVGKCGRALEGRPIRIGIIGRLVPVKRLDLFLRMARLLLTMAPGAFRFEIHGDGPERNALATLSRDLGVERFVTFHGFTENARRAMQDLDLLYVTSDSEGLPMVVLEAMASGLHVVARSVGELPEVLDGGRCGTLVGSHNPEAYAEPAMAFLSDRSAFLDKARAAQRRVETHYSASACAREYLRAYSQVLAQAGAARPPGVVP